MSENSPLLAPAQRPDSSHSDACHDSSGEEDSIHVHMPATYPFDLPPSRPKRSHGCMKRWHVIALTTFLMLILLLLPLLYFYGIPMIISQEITEAPPIQITLIDVKQLLRNQSISLNFGGALDIRPPFRATFLPGKYNFTMVSYDRRDASDRQVLNLGLLDMSALDATPSEPVVFEFPSLFHDSEDDHLRKVIGIVSEHVRETLHHEPGHVADRRYAIGLQSKVDVKMFGLTFKQVNFLHEVPLHWDFREYVRRMYPKLVKCSIPDANDYDCLSMITGDSTTGLTDLLSFMGDSNTDDDDDEDDDDPTSNLVVRVTASILNPTIFGLNFGKLNCTVDVLEAGNKEVEFAEVFFEDFHIQETQQSTSLYQNITVLAKPKDPLGALQLFQRWKAGEALHFGIKGAHMHFGGYNPDGGEMDAEIQHELSWFEQWLSELHLKITLPPPKASI